MDSDPEIRDLLEGTDGDPEKVRKKMRASLESRGTDTAMASSLGSAKQIEVKFRELDPAAAYVRPQMLVYQSCLCLSPLVFHCQVMPIRRTARII